MKNRTLLIAVATLLTMAGCRQKADTAFDWGHQNKIEYAVDYTVRFVTNHDSTMQVTATSNHGTAKVVRAVSEELVDADGTPVKNTFIILEDSVPAGKSIIMRRGGLTYGGGNPVFPHVQTVGSDDMVEFYVIGTADYTLYSIRDNMFFGPDERQEFTITGGKRFSIVLPVMTEKHFPKEAEIHEIKIGFDVG